MGKKSNTDVEVYDVLLEKFQKITSKMKHISPGDEEIGQKLLRKQAKKVQAQIVSYLKDRQKHGLELTDEMIAFEGLEKKLKDLLFEKVIKPQLKIADSNRKAMDEFYEPPTPEDIAKTKEKYNVRHPVSKYHEPVGEVDRTSYSNHTLYILADDMDDEWERNKDTEEFSCYYGDRIRFFEWCAQKYRYKGGKVFDAEGMVNSLTSSRTRAKSKKDKDYQ